MSEIRCGWTLSIVFFVMIPLVSVGLASGQSVGASEDSGELPVASRGDLRFQMGLSAFRGPEGFARLEVHLVLDAQQLQFESRSGQMVGEMGLVAAAVDTLESRTANQTWVRTVSVAHSDEMWQGVPFRDGVRFDLRPGRYRVLLHVRDLNSNREGHCETLFRVPDFDRSGLVFSDLQLATRLERSSAEDRFVKQGWKVVPNTSQYYVSGNPLPVYFELYNFLVESDQTDDSFILGYSLVDSTGQAVKVFPAKRYLKPGESAVKAEFLETEGLPEGMYRVQVEAYDGNSREYVRVRRPFYLISEQAPEGLTQVQQDMLGYYSDIRYIAEKKTLNIYEGLEDWFTKFAFLRAFWKRLDPTPATPTNERLVEHILRMSHADIRFESEPGRRGVDTDKGRVYVMYGPPDEIDYHTFVGGQKPFEVWFYERQGRHEFVFRDRRGSGIYELVHSTYPGELYNPSWQQDF